MLHEREGELWCEGVPLAQVAAKVGTPAYVYSAARLAQRLTAFQEAFTGIPARLCYAVKANGNLAILRRIFAAGFGADIVSGGELARVLKAGCKPRHVFFSGSGKTEAELAEACDAGIGVFQVEALFEGEALIRLARQKGCVIDVALRVNPDVDARTDPKISTGSHDTKFGLPLDVALSWMRAHRATKELRFVGLSCHVGSQLCDLAPLAAAARVMNDVARTLLAEGFPLAFVNMGGGLGIRYRAEEAPSATAYAATVRAAVANTLLELVVEPGRWLVADMGCVLTSVVGLKKTPRKTFVVVDAGMTDLVRPALYGAWHDIAPVRVTSAPREKVEVVGPVCESTDVLGRERELPTLVSGDLLCIRHAGAYGFAMASQYNARPRSVEVLIESDTIHVVRRRETYDDLWRHEETL